MGVPCIDLLMLLVRDCLLTPSALSTEPSSFYSCHVTLDGIDYDKIGLKQADTIFKKQNKTN